MINVIKKKKNKNIVILIVIAIILLVIFKIYNNMGSVAGDSDINNEVVDSISIEAQTIVMQDEITSKLSVSGTTIPREYSSLNSLAQGVVEYLYPVGSTITIGEPLFKIKNESIENAYFTAQQNQQQTFITTSQRVSQAELALNTVAARLVLAEKNLEFSKKQINQNFETTRSSAVVSYNSAYTTINQIINSLGTTSFHENSDYLYRDILTVNREYNNLTVDQFEKAKTSFANLSNIVTTDNVLMSLEKLYQALTETKNLTDRTAVVLQSAIVNDNFTNTELVSAKSLNSINQTSINQYIASVLSTKNSLDNVTSGYDLSIDQAQNQLELAQTEYKNAEISLSNSKIGADMENNLSQSQLSNASYNYNNLNTASPFSGIIMSHGVTPGEQISPGQKIIEVGNLNIMEVVVQIDSEFAKQLKLLDIVSVNKLYQGVISAITPTANLNSGNSSVTIAIDNSDNKLDAGRLVDIDFNLKYQKDNVIVVPIKAITIVANNTYVLLVKDGIATKQTITLGDTLGNQIVVLSGLELGDQVIVPNGVFVTAGDRIEVVNK